jgi:hypothetical protein
MGGLLLGDSRGGPLRFQVYADNGAITVNSHVAVLSKGTAGAYTLAAPTTAQNGTQILVLNTTGLAHVITVGAANAMIDEWGGAAIGNTLTLTAMEGIAVHLLAYNGKWYGGVIYGGGAISTV